MGASCSSLQKYSTCNKSCCCCAQKGKSKSKQKTLDLRKPIRKQSRPKMYYVKEKKLVKLKNWLLDKEDKDGVVKNEEFVELVKQNSNQTEGDYIIAQDNQLAMVSYSDLEYLQSSYQGSPDGKKHSNGRKTQSLKKKFQKRLYSLPKQKQYQNQKWTSSGSKKQRKVENQELKRIKRKQVLSQLSQTSRASEKQLIQKYIEGEKKMISTIQNSAQRTSRILGEALKSLDEKEREADMKAYVFN